MENDKRKLEHLRMDIDISWEMNSDRILVRRYDDYRFPSGAHEGLEFIRREYTSTVYKRGDGDQKWLERALTMLTLMANFDPEEIIKDD